MQDFLQLKLGIPLNLSMVLISYNKTIQAHLKECIITSLNIDLKESWTLSFKCPYYITDEIDRDKIINPNYDLVKEEKLIRLKCNDSYAVFVIKEISINSEDNTKTVTCYSIDKMISKEIVINGETIQLKSDQLETGIGVFDRMESSIRGWKLRYLDENAKLEQNSDVRSNKYRYFDNIEKKWSDFLKNDVASAFDVLLLFDTYFKRIDCYDRKSYGRDTGWTINKKNISKSISKKIDSKDLVTRLYVTGKDSMGISNVNPLGAYVENYDYFKSDMSSELQTALDKYKSRSEVLFVQWTNKNTQLLNLQEQYDNLTTQQISKEEEIKAKKVEQGIVIKDGTDYDVSRVKSELDTLNTSLASILQQKNSLQIQIDNYVNELSNLSKSFQVENIVDNNGVKIFNDNTLDELDAYINEKRESNEVFFTSHALYSWALDRIKEISKPLIEFSVESQNFLDDIKTYKNYNGVVAVADWFYVEHDKLGKEKVRLIGYTYNPEDKTLSLRFTNNDKSQSDSRSFSGIANKSIGTDRYLSYKKFEWNDASMQKDFVKDLRKIGLDAGLTEIFSQSNKNKISIDKSGIWISNAEDPNKIMVITASTIVISKDGLNSIDTAISTDGINADILVGRILAGENLYISNKNNDFRIDENGMSIDAERLTIRSASGNNKLQAHINITKNEILSKVSEDITAVTTNFNNTIETVENRITSAEEKITADAIVNTVTSSTKYTNNLSVITKQATDAQKDATNALDQLTSIASDTKLTPNEKLNVKKEWDIIVSEKSKLELQANTYAIITEKTNYTNAYNELSIYIIPLLSNLSITSDIVGTTFRGKFSSYYNARTELLRAITDKAKQLTDGLESRVSTAELKITDDAITSTVRTSTSYINDLNGKANQSDLDGAVVRISNAESSITQQANLIANKVSVDGVTSIIEQSSTQVAYAFNGITKNSSAKVIISKDGLTVQDASGNVTISNGVVTASKLQANTAYITGGEIEFDPMYKNGSAPTIMKFNYYNDNIKTSIGTFSYWADRFWFNRPVFIRGDLFLTNDSDTNGSNSSSYISAQITRNGDTKVKSLSASAGIDCNELGVTTTLNCNGRINCTELYVNGQPVGGQTLTVVAKFA